MKYKADGPYRKPNFFDYVGSAFTFLIVASVVLVVAPITLLISYGMIQVLIGGLK